MNGPHWKRWAPFCLDVDSIQSVEERLRNGDITIHVLFLFAPALISKRDIRIIQKKIGTFLFALALIKEFDADWFDASWGPQFFGMKIATHITCPRITLPHQRFEKIIIIIK